MRQRSLNGKFNDLTSYDVVNVFAFFKKRDHLLDVSQETVRPLLHQQPRNDRRDCPNKEEVQECYRMTVSFHPDWWVRKMLHG